MYIEAAVSSFIQSLLAASSSATDIYIAHGRNRQAESTFVEACKGRLSISHISSDQLDEVYQTGDVDILLLHKI